MSSGLPEAPDSSLDLEDLDLQQALDLLVPAGPGGRAAHREWADPRQPRAASSLAPVVCDKCSHARAMQGVQP